MAAVNVRCLPDVDLETLKIVKFDGRRHSEANEAVSGDRLFAICRAAHVAGRALAPCLFRNCSYIVRHGPRTAARSSWIQCFLPILSRFFTGNA